MLSDLAQYFTKTETTVFGYSEDYDLVNYLMYVYKNTLNDSFKNGIAQDIIYKPDGFYEAFETFSSCVFDGNAHLEDALEHVTARDNMFLDLIFSTVFCDSQATLSYEDYEFSAMLNFHPEIESYSGCHLNRKIDKYVDKFIIKEMEGWSDGNGCIEENSADMTRVIIGYIHFSDKSFARKLRKAYARNSLVRKAFGELNMYMENGCFIILLIYNIEDWSYCGADYIDINGMIDGFTELRKELKIDNFNQIGRALSIGFQKLNFNLYQNDNYTGYQSTFAKSLIINLSKKIAPPDKEVIL